MFCSSVELRFVPGSWTYTVVEVLTLWTLVTGLCVCVGSRTLSGADRSSGLSWRVISRLVLSHCISRGEGRGRWGGSAGMGEGEGELRGEGGVSCGQWQIMALFVLWLAGARVLLAKNRAKYEKTTVKIARSVLDNVLISSQWSRTGITIPEGWGNRALFLIFNIIGRRPGGGRGGVDLFASYLHVGLRLKSGRSRVRIPLARGFFRGRVIPVT